MVDYKQNFEVYLENGGSVKFNCSEVESAELKDGNRVISLILKKDGADRKIDMGATDFRRAIRYSGSCVAEFGKWEDLLKYVNSYFR